MEFCLQEPSQHRTAAGDYRVIRMEAITDTLTHSVRTKTLLQTQREPSIFAYTHMHSENLSVNAVLVPNHPLTSHALEEANWHTAGEELRPNEETGGLCVCVCVLELGK